MQKHLALLPLAALLFCGAAAHAKVINPLIAPKPAGVDQTNQAPGTPGAPAGQASPNPGQRQGMPQGMPPSPPPPSGSMGDFGAKPQVVSVFPVELAGLDDKWFVSAITGNSAILRLRDASIGVAPGAGASPSSSPQPGMSPGMQNMGMQGQGAAVATAGASVIQRSILVSNGKPLDFKGFALQVAIQDGIVRLTHLHEGQRVNVFHSGVDVFAVRRAPQVTKETPAANLPRLMNSGAGAAGASSSTPGTQSSPGMTGGQTF